MVQSNKNQIKSVVRDWVKAGLLQHYKREQKRTKKLIDGLENYINDLVEVNNQIYKIEEKAFNHASESENESESESENNSDSKSNVDDDKPKIIPRYFGPKKFDLSKIKKCDMGPYNKDTNTPWRRKTQEKKDTVEDKND